MNFKDVPRNRKGKVIVDQVRFPIRYQMLKPVERAERTVEDVDLQEPTVAEVEVANKEPTPTASNIRLIALAAGLSTDEVRAMGMRDYLPLSGLFLDFG